MPKRLKAPSLSLRAALRDIPSVHSVAQTLPLVAAIIAPITTLLDIPALSQRWYTENGIAQPDYTASLVLSGLGLALNVAANLLLLVRFSVTSHWRTATRVSLLCWLLKTLIAIVRSDLSTFAKTAK